MVRRLRTMRWFGFALVIFIPLEHLSTLPLTTRIPVREEVPAVYRWLHDSSREPVAEVPVNREAEVRKERCIHQFIIGSQSSTGTRVTNPSYETASSALEGRSVGDLRALEKIGVDTLVLHRRRSSENGSQREIFAGGAPRRSAFSREFRWTIPPPVRVWQGRSLRD